jgi:hypothetical protein
MRCDSQLKRYFLHGFPEKVDFFYKVFCGSVIGLTRLLPFCTGWEIREDWE